MFSQSIRGGLDVLLHWEITVLIVCALVSPIDAIEVDISGQRITIPSPAGFSEVGSISPDTFSMFEALLPAGSRLLGVFASHEDVGRLLRREQADFQQYMLVQSDKTLEEFTLGKSEFGELRTVFRRQFEQMVQKSRESIDATIKKAEETVSRRLGTQVGMKMDKMVCLGVDSETASSISASLLTTYALSTAHGRVQSVMASALTTVLVKGKVFRLYVYRRYETDTDMVWAREQSEGWFKSILAANETTWPATSGKIVPQGTLVTSTVKELLSGEWAEYSLRSHPKAGGLNVSVKYPKSWKAQEGIRPHIVQKFTGPIKDGLSPSCMVIVQSMPTWAGLFLQGQIAAETLKENLKEMIPNGATFLDGGQTKLDGEPCAWVKYSYGSEYAGVQVRMYCLQYMLFYRGNVLAIECAVGGVADDPVLRDAFASHLPVFQMIGNSVVIQDKWTNGPAASFDGLMEYLFGPYWQLALFLVAILTFGLGLLAPLIIRLFLRHPMVKRSAALYTMNFLILNTALIFFTGYDRLPETFGTLLIMSMIPYGILRRGKDKYEREFAMRRAADSQRSPAGQAAPTLRHLLLEEGQKPPSIDQDERYMPPEMRERKTPEDGQKFARPEAHENPAVPSGVAGYAGPELDGTTEYGLPGATPKSQIPLAVSFSEQSSPDEEPMVPKVIPGESSVDYQSSTVGSAFPNGTGRRAVLIAFAIAACGAETLAYAIIGALLGWRHGGGIIPVMILFAVLGATWRAITKGSSRKEPSARSPGQLPKDAGAAEEGGATSRAMSPPDEASVQVPPLTPAPLAGVRAETEAGGTAEMLGPQSRPPAGDERYMPPEMRARQVGGTPIGDYALHEPERIAGRSPDALVDMCHALTTLPISQPTNKEHATQESSHSVVESSWEPTYGGIGRLTYVLSMFGLTFVYTCWRVAAANNPDSIWVASLMAFVILLPLVVARLHNIGTSGWWVLLMFIPLANLAVSIPCLVCPPGYSYTRKLDAVGKVLSCLGICLLVLLVVIGLFSSI